MIPVLRRYLRPYRSSALLALAPGDMPRIGQIRQQTRVFIVRVSADVKHAPCVCQAIKGMRECS